MERQIALRVNGRLYQHQVPTRALLAQYLRDVLGLTGTHFGCETSQCGTCTVVLNSTAVKACTVLAVQADGGEVLTVEGLARPGELHPLQRAFWERHGLQCGYCTPGMLMSAYGLLQRQPDPSPEQIRQAIHGNLCRCTGYKNIVEAIRAAAGELRGAAEAHA
jgi:carbon-monoxide dehydrogenase small subunit